MKKYLTKKNITRSITGICILVFIIFGFWFFQSYPPEPEKLASVEANSALLVEDKGNYYLLRNRDNDPQTLIIFYPGGKVQPLSYAYNLSGLVSTFVSVAITKPLFNYAFLSIDIANQVIENEPDYSQIYLMGHSLGGVMGCFFAQSNQEKLEGLILLASYCTNDLSGRNLEILSILGSKDGLINMENVTNSRSNLPESAKTVVIEGLNHSQFGSYGSQQGDFDAQISDSQARTLINQKIIDFIF